MNEDFATEFVMECLHCYIIPPSCQIVRQYIPGKYNTGYSAYINIDNIPRCDLDGALSAMGVVSYTEYDSLENVVTSYGRDCLKADMHWLDPEVEEEVKSIMGYKECNQELSSMYGKNVGSMAADLADNQVKRLSEAMHEDLNKLNAVDNYKCDQASAYAATLMNYPHIYRMQCERDDLLHNMAKLSNYYENHFSELTGKQRDYMCKELTVMRTYADILQDHITYDIQYYSYNTQ